MTKVVTRKERAKQYNQIKGKLYPLLSHNIASESDITPCNKIDKP